LLKGHGSQGEIRSVLLALKLAEIELFRESTGIKPVLLIDDFSSELDRNRREMLLKSLLDAELQVFVTGTERPQFEGRYFQVSQGDLKKDYGHGFGSQSEER
jgi:DNA replication and repair protein RecF